MTSLNEFFTENPVFTVEEVDHFLRDRGGPTSSQTRKNLLQHHRKQGRIVSIRRGLYASIPPGSDPRAYPVDRFLVASRLTGDAVIAYHSALEFHGSAYSVHEARVTYLTGRSKGGAFSWRGITYQPVQQPAAVAAKGCEQLGTEEVDRRGLPVRVTTLERTLVDIFDRPALGGGWEENWRSLELISYLNIPVLLEYVRVLDNATTAAKVGLFLELHRESLGVTDEDLAQLERAAPKQPVYLERGKRESGKLIARWNLVVPQRVLRGDWEAHL
jgi:predicted transcriptional regulator of viral defense system